MKPLLTSAPFSYDQAVKHPSDNTSDVRDLGHQSFISYLDACVSQPITSLQLELGKLQDSLRKAWWLFVSISTRTTMKGSSRLFGSLRYSDFVDPKVL